MDGMIPSTFQNLFQEHHAHVVRKISYIVGDITIAEDLAQEVFLKLYRSPPDDLHSIGAWLHRVLTSTTYDYLRQSQRRQALQLKELQRFQSESGESPSNEIVAIANWEKEAVQRALLKLSERDREALMLKQKGYSYTEIAERISVNPKIIGSILMRAASRFKKTYLLEEARTP